MYLIEPIAIDLEAVSVSLAEDDAPVWDGATTYELGARVVRAHQVFQSLMADNLGNDPLASDQDTVGAPWGVVRYTAAFAMFDGILSNPSKAAREPLANDLVARAAGGVAPSLLLDFEAGEYLSGPIGPLSAIGVDPISAPLVVDFEASPRLDAIGLFGVSAFAIEVVCLDVSGNEVARHERSGAARIVSGWWEWFTVPPEPISDRVVFSDLPASTARLVLSLSGESVALGEVVIGRARSIGAMLAHGTIGRGVIGSKYEFNEFGTLTMVKRPTRRDMTYSVDVSVDGWKSVEPILARNGGGLVAAVGVEDRPSTINFGLLGPAEWSEDDPHGYTYSFTIKGLA